MARAFSVVLGQMWLLLCLICLKSLHGFSSLAPGRGLIRLNLPKQVKVKPHSRLIMWDTSTDNDSVQSNEEASQITAVAEETPAEKARREQLERIQELKDKEVFVKRNTGKYECQACGYIYDETKGYAKKGIAPGTPFDTIEKFRCPQCGANKKYFVPETETVSGFKDNLKYGLGANALTSGQKSLLIFGGLLLGFAVFMGGYLLE